MVVAVLALAVCFFWAWLEREWIGAAMLLVILVLVIISTGYTLCPKGG